MVLTALVAALLATVALHAAPPPAMEPSCMVWPFENRSGDPSLNWIGDSFEVAFRQQLDGSGVSVLSREQRLSALALNGTPSGVALSHATEMQIATEVGARFMVAGWFNSDGVTFSAGAWVFDLKSEHLFTPPAQSGPLDDIETLQAALGSAVRRLVAPSSLPPSPTPALPLPAYESYVRAELAPTPALRLKALNVAAHLAPKDPRVEFELGSVELAVGDNADAVAALQSIPDDSPNAPQAQFDVAVAEYRLGRYAQSAAAFRELGVRYPLPAVASDLALALAQSTHPSPHPPTLNTSFPAAAFRQLQTTVAEFDAARLQNLAPAERIKEELTTAAHLETQGGWDAAAQQYARVLASSSADSTQLAAAHAGMAAVWLARHDSGRAQKEIAAALAADPSNAAALALQRRLRANSPPVAKDPPAPSNR